MFHLGALSNCLIGLVVVQALPLASYTLYKTYFKLLVAFKCDSLTHRTLILVCLAKSMIVPPMRVIEKRIWCNMHI